MFRASKAGPAAQCLRRIMRRFSKEEIHPIGARFKRSASYESIY